MIKLSDMFTVMTQSWDHNPPMQSFNPVALRMARFKSFKSQDVPLYSQRLVSALAISTGLEWQGKHEKKKKNTKRAVKTKISAEVYALQTLGLQQENMQALMKLFAMIIDIQTRHNAGKQTDRLKDKQKLR